jgi:pimeloyl-ACP methyl ester carboxylesterase
VPDGSPQLKGGVVVVDGVRSPVLRAGPDDATEAVVFVHGNPGGGEDWQDLVLRTGEFARAIAPDMPGFAKADRPKDFRYDVLGYSHHLQGVLEELGVERAHLVLHDFGGPWGLHWAAEHPDRVASITLVNTGVLIGYRWHYLARIWRTPVLGEIFQAITTERGLRIALRHGNPRGLPEPFLRRTFDHIDRGTKRAVLKLYRATPAAAMGPLVPVLREECPVPVLVVWGMHDPYLPFAQAEAQRQVWPHCRIEQLPESGHWPMADDPEGLAGFVVPFLREQNVA